MSFQYSALLPWPCRNIFEGRKWVEEYRAEDVTRELGLGREELIQLALLLGSDYTEGISGIGIVNAVEVVRAFKGVEGMKVRTITT